MKLTFIFERPTLTGQGKALVLLSQKLIRRGFRSKFVALHPLLPGWAPLPTALKIVDRSSLRQIVQQSDIVIATHRAHARFVWQLAQRVGVQSLYLYDEPELFSQTAGRSLTPKERAVLDLVQAELIRCFRLPWPVVTPGRFTQKRIWRLARRRVDVIPQAIDQRLFRPEEKKPENKLKTILLVGPTKSAYKGIPVGYEAYQRLIRRGALVRLVRVSQEREKLNLRNVNFFFSPSSTRLAEIYRSADVLWWTSYAEVFPLPPLEAMASGIPVITSRISAVLEEYGREGKNCLAYCVGNSSELAGQTERLFSDDPLRKRLIKNGLNTARRFTWRKLIDRFETLLRSF